ncbi:MAG: hypothetical protein OXR64_09850 [Chloroflexota bacterium]|nr:hypothetical protein [Chloroflexota bacterium]MDE2920135.1 hypothetical protein [Chloroflexota bacterium]
MGDTDSSTLVRFTVVLDGPDTLHPITVEADSHPYDRAWHYFKRDDEGVARARAPSVKAIRRVKIDPQ